MKRNGAASSGATRWRCKECGASMTHRIDSTAKRLKAFLKWLMGKGTLQEQSCSKATFERRPERLWELWPLPHSTGEVFDVLFVDGIHITKKLVIPIACSHEHVAARHLARSECSESWAALMVKLAPPAMVITDGGAGFKKAVRVVWPNTRVRRCLAHVKRRVARKTTMSPKPDCGRGLLELAKRSPRVKGTEGATAWLVNYAQWCSRWEHFLRELTSKDGHRQYAHERLRSARHPLSQLVKDKTTFTFIEMQGEHGGIWDRSDNLIEGKVNSQIRLMPLNHRGLTTIRRVKATFWWCCLHSEFKVSEAEMVKIMPTDEDVGGLFALAPGPHRRDDGYPDEFGQGAPEWGELHMRGSKDAGRF